MSDEFTKREIIAAIQCSDDAYLYVIGVRPRCVSLAVFAPRIDVPVGATSSLPCWRTLNLTIKTRCLTSCLLQLNKFLLQPKLGVWLAQPIYGNPTVLLELNSKKRWRMFTYFQFLSVLFSISTNLLFRLHGALLAGTYSESAVVFWNYRICIIVLVGSWENKKWIFNADRNALAVFITAFFVETSGIWQAN